VNLTRASGVTVLACAGLLVSSLADAQARGPSPWARQRADRAVGVAKSAAEGSGRISDFGVWLERLVGRYEIDGNVDQAVGFSKVQVGVSIHVNRKVSGAADCRGIGEGAGVHCVINVEWQPISWLDAPSMLAPSESFTMRPAVLLFGIDAAASGIHVLQVDGRSIAISALGTLSGDTLQMETNCGAYVPGARCERLVRITAKPASDLIQMEIAIFGSPLFTFNLRREPPP
jgi:hypothetical protein